MLDATVIAQRLYEKSGFRGLHAINDWMGIPSLPPADCPRLSADYLPSVAAYDLPRFGADRSRVLSRLATEFPHLARVHLGDDGVVRGYILGCRREKVITIGPWLHDSAQGAAQLLGSIIPSCGGRSLLIRVPHVNNAAAVVLENAGLRRAGSQIRMILGGADPPGQPEFIYASPDY